MRIRLFNAFVKLTALPVQWVCFRTKVYYEDRAAQGKRIRGAAILISNHTSVFDYAVYLFVFFWRTLRFQMAEVLYTRKMLGPFLRGMGGIKVNRNTFDFGFIAASQEILFSGGVVGVFPESRLPRKGEERPLPFKTSAAFLALSSNAPVIPLYTNGSYFCQKRARVMVGKPFYARDLTDSALSEKENIQRVSDAMRARVIDLGRLLDERTGAPVR